MNKLLLFLSLFVVIIACDNTEKKHSKPTIIGKTKQTKNKNIPQIDSALIACIKEDLSAQSSPFNKNGNSTEITSGLIFPPVTEAHAKNIFLKYLNRMKQSGNYIFLTDLQFNQNHQSLYSIAVINTNDQFEIIKKIQTCGNNTSNRQIIDYMIKWHKEVQFTSMVIDRKRIHAYMSRKPDNIALFAKETYALCPNIIDQGYGTMDAMIEDMNYNNTLWLWWD